jgi:hypothetical protein
MHQLAQPSLLIEQGFKDILAQFTKRLHNSQAKRISD